MIKFHGVQVEVIPSPAPGQTQLNLLCVVSQRYHQRKIKKKKKEKGKSGLKKGGETREPTHAQLVSHEAKGKRKVSLGKQKDNEPLSTGVRCAFGGVG